MKLLQQILDLHSASKQHQINAFIEMISNSLCCRDNEVDRVIIVEHCVGREQMSDAWRSKCTKIRLNFFLSAL